jgi:hypothetical protein
MLKTNQGVLNTAFRNLMKQGRFSSDSHGMCLYRGPEGSKCAIGSMIPDELYSKKLEGNLINDAEMHGVRDLAFGPKVDDHLLRALQSAHDDRSLRSSLGWELVLPSVYATFEQVAVRFGLKTDYIKNYYIKNRYNKENK